MRNFILKSKKGFSLVEVVLSVVILSLFALGILTLLLSGNRSVSSNAQKGEDHSMATEKLDAVISALSGGNDLGFLIYDEESGALSVNSDKLCEKFELESITVKTELYEEATGEIASNIRGWYLTVSYKGTTVKGFASNTQGAFD